MKKYKMLIISLLLLIFMVGAVSAADENVTDDNLEITDEISVDEEAVASDVVEEDMGAEEQSSLDDEILAEPPSDANLVVLDQDWLQEDFSDLSVSSFWHEDNNVSFVFMNSDGTPYSNGEVVFSFGYDEFGTWEFKIKNCTVNTDSEGYGFIPLKDWEISEYDLLGFDIGETHYDISGSISIKFDGVTVYVDDTTYIDPQIKFLYGEEKYFKARFVDWEGNVYSNMDVTLPIINWKVLEDFDWDSGEDPFESAIIKTVSLTTDEYGVASFLMDFDIGTYGFYMPEIDGMQFNLQGSIIVIDPTIMGSIRIEVRNNQDPIISTKQSITYIIWIFDQLENPIPNAQFQYSIYNITNNISTSQYGSAVLEIGSLPVGNHTLVVNYPELNITANSTLCVLEDVSTLHADNLTVVIGDGFEYVVKVTDKFQTPQANQFVTMVIGSTRYGPVYSDENGIAIFDLDLDVGVYDNIRMWDGGGTVLYPTIIVLANPSISTPVDTSFNCSSGSNKYAMSFTNINGTPLANGTVEVSIDGVYNYTLTTDENGTVDLILPSLAGGDHIMTITNPVTGEKITTTITYMKEASSISTAAVTTVYNGGKYVVFTLKDSNGAVLSGKDVSVVLNGKTIKGVTDANGQFKVSTDGLAPKAYTATITFAGDDYLVKSTATAKITVKKATPKMTAKKATFKAKKKTKKYSIVLKDNKNKAMKKVKVTLKVGKKTYKATTNSKGKATFKITKLTKKGKYTAKVKFAGNKNYNAVTKKVKITVKK